MTRENINRVNRIAEESRSLQMKVDAIRTALTQVDRRLRDIQILAYEILKSQEVEEKAKKNEILFRKFGPVSIPFLWEEIDWEEPRAKTPSKEKPTV
jgi:hypothetical protein